MAFGILHVRAVVYAGMQFGGQVDEAVGGARNYKGA
jgi:hypothetical protein